MPTLDDLAMAWPGRPLATRFPRHGRNEGCSHVLALSRHVGQGSRYEEMIETMRLHVVATACDDQPPEDNH